MNDSIATATSPGQDKIRTLCITGTAIVGAALVALFASQTSGIVAAIGIGGLIFLASSAMGAVFGFVFGLPRILSRDKSAAEVTTIAQENTIQGIRKRLLNSNTNLEQVSDWLTTMIVGVGLTQLSAINGTLYRFRVFLKDTATVFPDAHGGNAGALPTVGPLLLLFGLVLGFLFLYLYTRINLAVLLSQVEADLEAQTIKGSAAHAVRDAASTLPGIEENPTLMSLVKSEEPPVYESIELMGSLLYQEGRYQSVIELGGKLSNTPATRRAEYWLYLAAAFGQKYHALKSTPGSSQTELVSARDNALDCARRAVKIDPSMKTRLWFISDPNGDDNDLADFRDDAEFLAITGKRGRSAA